MKKSYLSKGIVLVMIGICFILAAVFTENVIDGLLWGLAGGALGPGIARIIQYFYWSAPKNQERYREIQEQQDINLHDELNEKLRDKSGRIAYHMVVFSLLGKTGVITDHRVIVLYLFGLLVFQIVAGIIAYNLLRKRY